MLKTSFFRALLIPTAILALTACGGEDDSETAASESNSPSATSSSAPAAAAAKSDEEVCKAVTASMNTFREAMVESLMAADEPTDEALTEIFSELATGMTEIAATGSADSEVTIAMQALSVEAEKMVADPNLMEGADNPAYESAAEAVTEACQKVGVEIE